MCNNSPQRNLGRPQPRLRRLSCTSLQGRGFGLQTACPSRTSSQRGKYSVWQMSSLRGKSIPLCKVGNSRLRLGQRSLPRIEYTPPH